MYHRYDLSSYLQLLWSKRSQSQPSNEAKSWSILIYLWSGMFQAESTYITLEDAFFQSVHVEIVTSVWFLAFFVGTISA